MLYHKNESSNSEGFLFNSALKKCTQRGMKWNSWSSLCWKRQRSVPWLLIHSSMEEEAWMCCCRFSSSNRKPCVRNSRTGVADLPRRERVEQSERNNANESGKDLSCLHHCPCMVTRQYGRFSPVVIYSRENNSVHQPNFHPVSHSL